MEAHLAFNAPETEQFRQHYKRLVNFDMPMIFVEEAVARDMHEAGRKYFRVPARLTSYGKDLFFVFDVDEELAHKQIVYRYNRVTTKDIVLVRYEPVEGVSKILQTDEYGLM